MLRPSVIYIMGCGRSGTTILDMILGNHSGFLNVGELNRARLAWIGEELCSCGVPMKKCVTWQKVAKIWFANEHHYDVQRIREYQNDIERHSGMWRIVFDSYDQHKIQVYYSYWQDIYKILSNSSSANAIVDSSKNVGRVFALLSNSQMDVKVIHLTRDPRGVYYSFQKKDVNMPVNNILKVALYWNTVNSLANLIGRRFGEQKILRIRYEDLISKPVKTIDVIAGFLREDLSDVKTKLRNSVPLDRGHVCAGNRLRTQTLALKLRPDLEWTENLKFHHRLIITVLCFPLMNAYGYLTS